MNTIKFIAILVLSSIAINSNAATITFSSHNTTSTYAANVHLIDSLLIMDIRYNDSTFVEYRHILEPTKLDIDGIQKFTIFDKIFNSKPASVIIIDGSICIFDESKAYGYNRIIISRYTTSMNDVIVETDDAYQIELVMAIVIICMFIFAILIMIVGYTLKHA